MNDPWGVLWLLVCVHALCDYSLQTDSMALGKNRHLSKHPVPWYHWLAAHAAIHGGAVTLVTGSAALGAAESALHWAIDFCKCDGWTTMDQDQLLHLLCKVVWAACLFCK